jgi:hypothetical protein
MSTQWKVLSKSTVGTSHILRGEGCQDYSHAIVLQDGGMPVLLAACADGAGSSSQAAIGAKLATLGVLNLAAEALREADPHQSIGRDEILKWYAGARRRLSLEACVTNLPLREFACTLLLAVVGQDRSVFAQIGDGATVYRASTEYEVAIWPQAGEYASTTHFLTGEDYSRRLAVCVIDQQVVDVALLTDGLQPLALHYATKSAHVPFFTPMFEAMRGTAEASKLMKPFCQFLDSPAVNTRTDDDKTLILATR